MTNFCLGRTSSDPGWKSQLNLGFTEDGKRTVLSQRKHKGPLQVQKPFYPEANGTCHVYILHPPGGVVGGDHFDIQVEVGSNANALITTPSAGKFYRSAGPTAFQNLNIKVADHGALEWFPAESIFFSGAKAMLKTKIDLSEKSYFAGWDVVCLGRPASGEQFSRGNLTSRFEVWRNERPIRLDRLVIQENDPILDAKWGLLGKPVVGNFVCFTARKDLVGLLRQRIPPPEKGNFFSVTFVDGIIFCRYLGDSVEQAKQYFVKAWQILRFALRGCRAVIPRIWST